MRNNQTNPPGKYLRKKPDTGIRLAAPFLVTLALMTALSFALPLRPAVSMIEKRELAKFPEFSWEALTEGSYFDEITTWFSDTFPGREDWLLLSTDISSFHGYSEISIGGALPMVEEIPTVEPTLPPTQPAQEPEDAAPETVAEETVVETTASTEPTQWGGVDAGDDAVIDLGTIIQIGDSAFNSLRFSEHCSIAYANAVSKFADIMVEHNVRVVSAPAPTAVGVLIEPQYLEKLNCADQEEMLNYIHGRMSDNVIKVNTFEKLVSHNSEYIYFRTDHHWTALGAYYSYTAICEALGYEAAPLDSFREWDMGEFHGSLFYKVARPRKLTPDNLYAYVPQGDIETYIQHDGGREEIDLIQDMTQREVYAKYGAFIRNDNPLTVITNHSLPDAPNCILLKDSFGNALAPFLTQNYHQVFVVDYRKFNNTLQWLMSTNEVVDIIAAPYLIATQSTAGGQLFGRLFQYYERN